MTDEVTPPQKPEAPKICPFIPPIPRPGIPGMSGPQFELVECFGRRCAAFELCQVAPKSLESLSDAIAGHLV
jgi:hypothetical protein